MSEHCVAVVRIDPLTDAEAERGAAAAQRWLADEGLLGGPDDGERPALARDGARFWQPGPRLAARTLAPDLPAVGAVGVTGRRELHHAYGNAEASRCGACGTALDDGADTEAVGTWWESSEPDVRCPVCGWTAPYGDWRSDWPSVVGAPAVPFHLDSDPGQELLDAVAARLAGRTRVVRTHL